MNSRDVINAYKQALNSVTNSIYIDNTLSETKQIEILSTVLNASVKINEIIPIDLLKIDNLVINKEMDSLGSFAHHTGDIDIKDVKSSHNMANTIAHEYGHYLFETIIMEGSQDMISELYSLCEEMGDVFLNRPDNYIASLAKNKSSSDFLNYLAKPTEMFARAFSVYALESSEKKYETHKSKGGSNFSLEELSKFKVRMDKLCMQMREQLINKERETNPYYQIPAKGGVDLFQDLTEADQVTLLKNEERLFLKASGERNVAILQDDYKQAKLSNADMEIGATSFRKLYKKFDKEALKYVRFNHETDFIDSIDIDTNVDKYLAMTPDRVYSLNKGIREEIKKLKKQESEFQEAFNFGVDNLGSKSMLGYTIDNNVLNSSKENFKYIKQTIALKEQELKAIELSGVTKTPNYKKYAALKSKEEKVVSFVENFNLDGKFESRFEHIPAIMKLKDMIYNVCGSRLCDLQRQVATMESSFDQYYRGGYSHEYSESYGVRYSEYLSNKNEIARCENVLEAEDSLLGIYMTEEDIERHREKLVDCYEKKDTFNSRLWNFDKVTHDSISKKLKNKLHELMHKKQLKGYEDIDINNIVKTKGTYSYLRNDDKEKEEQNSLDEDFTPKEDKRNKEEVVYSSAKEQINAIINRIKGDKNNAKENSNRISSLSVEANNRINQLLQEAEAKEAPNSIKTVDYEYDNDDLSI